MQSRARLLKPTGQAVIQLPGAGWARYDQGWREDPITHKMQMVGIALRGIDKRQKHNIYPYGHSDTTARLACALIAYDGARPQRRTHKVRRSSVR